jgi:hypothetical protein
VGDVRTGGHPAAPELAAVAAHALPAVQPAHMAIRVNPLASNPARMDPIQPPSGFIVDVTHVTSKEPGLFRSMSPHPDSMTASSILLELQILRCRKVPHPSGTDPAAAGTRCD